MKIPSSHRTPIFSSPARADSLLVSTQMALLKDFDSQMRDVGRQMKFLGEIKRHYRDNMDRIQQFLTQNTDDSRKDGKRCLKADAAQLSSLCDAFTEFSYDLDKMSFREIPLNFDGNGENHELDRPPDPLRNPWIRIENGHFNGDGLRKFFDHAAGIKDPQAAADHAKKLGDDDSNLPFYYGHSENRDKMEFPLFNVYVENLERVFEKLQSRLSGVEEKTEELGIRFNQLSAQRKSSLDNLGQLLAARKQVQERVPNNG